MVALIPFLLLSTVAAIPAPIALTTREQTTPHAPSPWDAGATTQYPIHQSCNATQRRQIEAGLNETIALVDHAKAHILRWGNESTIYRKYFGNRPSFEAIGAYDIVSNGDKGSVLFRCDNPDGNCDNEGWAGHWRGENGTAETVICDLSYSTRRSLTSMCSLGYTISGSETNTFWAADLLHRLFHMPPIGQSWVEHFADGYGEVLELAAGNKSTSTRDSETLQYFALEAYAYDIAAPGVGCVGEYEENEEAADDAADDLPENCHTHEGGEVHCT
ncbi:putative peptidase domain-containing protein [Aspergillus pseudonomiae]|uniref:Putative peptidase domain-containing protein n=1 Tax=Aspergillus pseudonomiae TaxID=1506151 RepID=A0A5N6IIQ9_9EURO|nr:putative peptidase domain-containing protein [Aspergillus pseudonomiae]KAB8265729.1 putative peptidase domain-containing protein [Aspergillus pseudonomiae]KAE8405776.1 putative peptidase domain-containing protein [Aspergillus pseudonomiae]